MPGTVDLFSYLGGVLPGCGRPVRARAGGIAGGIAGGPEACAAGLAAA